MHPSTQKKNGAQNISVAGLLLLRYGACLPQHIDDRNNQAT